MIGSSMSAAFWVDDRYDQDMASDGCSRYGAYVRQKAHMFREGDDWIEDNVRFALTAWRIAQAPIMWPGYVRNHPRILDNCEHWDDEGRAALAIDLAWPLPTQVARTAMRLDWYGWEPPDERWIEPYDNDRPAAFATLVVRVPLPAGRLPTPRYQNAVPHVHTAQLAVRTICGLIHNTAELLLDQL
jgi:hypothetical protein